MAAPGIILTSAFTLPSAQTFSGFTGYITRAGALAEKTDRSVQEDIELSLINSKLFEHRDEVRDTTKDTGQERASANISEKNLAPGATDEATEEANRVISGEQKSRDRYLSYMTRAKALLKEPNRSDADEEELQRVKAGMQQVTEDDTKRYLGTFTATKHNLNEEDLTEVRGQFDRGQAHGSVLYEDVVSFDTSFLEDLGVYDSANDKLDEVPLIRAGRAMIDNMQKAESLGDVTWMASFHRNTDHIHIHFATIEQDNTRPLEVRGEGDDQRIEPHGARKQSTIDTMKATFARELVDRTAERTRIGKLRDGLIKEVRDAMPGNDQVADSIFNLYQELPDDRRQWHYAQIHGEQREHLDAVVAALMDENPNYGAYQAAVQKSAEVDQKLFGHSQRASKDYADNQMQDVNKRLGNQVLGYLSNLDKAEATGFADAKQIKTDDKLSYDYLETVAKTIKGHGGGDDETVDEAQRRLRREEQRRRNRREENSSEEIDNGMSGRKNMAIRGSIRRDVATLKRSMSDYMDEDRYAAMREHDRAQRAEELGHNI